MGTYGDVYISAGLGLDWEPSRLVLVLSLFVVSYYSGILFRGSEDGNMHEWGIEITKFLVPAPVSSVFSAGDGVFMSKTADGRITANGSRFLVPVSDRLAR